MPSGILIIDKPAGWTSPSAKGRTGAPFDSNARGK